MPSHKVELADLQPQRREVKPSQWGIAAPTTSETFKIQSRQNKPLAKDWRDRLSHESAVRQGSRLKGAFKHVIRPDIISLGGGVPLTDYNPFDNMRFTTPRAIDGQIAEKQNQLYSTKHDIQDGQSVYDISVAFNYGQGGGSAPLLRWVTEHTEIVHNPRYADWQVILSLGNTSAWDMVVRMLTKPGDVILSEGFTFSSAAQAVEPLGVKFFGIELDEQGPRPDSLRHILENWDPSEHGGSPKPFLYYAIPTGQNPTGTTQSVQRRKDIYQVAQEHDLLIVEDDPYYYLQMDPYEHTKNGNGTQEIHRSPLTSVDLIEVLVPSYLALDTDGRVLRLDSFSKVISPGLRVGWVTGPQQLIEKYKNHADCSTQSPSGLSQLALYKLLEEQWGHKGFLDWLVYLRQEYTKRRAEADRVLSEYLPGDIASWTPPEAGMFFWVKLDWKKHPQAANKTAEEIEEIIWKDIIDEGAFVSRGSWFAVKADHTPEEVHYRLAFASAPSEKLEKAIQRFGDGVKNSFKDES